MDFPYAATWATVVAGVIALATAFFRWRHDDKARKAEHNEQRRQEINTERECLERQLDAALGRRDAGAVAFIEQRLRECDEELRRVQDP